LTAAPYGHRRAGHLSDPVWWTGYLVIAIWAQELSGGFDFLAPGLLVCLQTGRWWTVAWLTVLWTLVQEGLGSLAFGVAVLFYAGMFGFFLLTRWLLEPENPLFILLFSLVLSVWAWLVLSGAISFQEIGTRMHSPWPWIAKQWLAYLCFWVVMLAAYRRWGGHGRV
jgi:hypothetical protein